ncbi:type I-B CRISPR-associated protein Cas7/Csh2 [uncultured Methanosphaera sp.]|uniref:type I-B CRISPR-associated protein Cas7/Csh2 n=1 Tax=uncultured Methanosphaera sp. TaxID=262501 RepID=UPI0028060CA3|nr:type I-B CRISPR-associated protein Cas7/Csh2 [uncultured Methanosphaera sp.]
MNRSEILFLYDITDANPNGDPLDENKPRLDEETEINIVTDVRLKRTIRDYLENYEDEEIFVKEKQSSTGEGLQDAKTRALDYLKEEKFETLDDAKKALENEILSSCIDVRLFGATIPLDIKIKSKKKTGSITLTGPVQFRMGRSLHKVEIEHIRGTGAFASTDGKTQKTFREEYILPYSLIAFYGAINENAAKTTQMTEDDIEKLLSGIWNGTKNLVTRSKFGQTPRLLLQIEYSEDNFFIGDLNNKISLKHTIEDKKIRNINEVKLGYDKLKENLSKNKDKISKIRYKIDNNLDTTDESKNLIEVIKSLDIQTEEIIL